jgi:Mg2+-importing ATPase
MLPSQILLNNLLYDTSQLAIPTDEVDPEQLARPAHWDVGFVRRFMLVFGPVSSLFDVLTFVVMLKVFSAGPALFRSGWFVESLATQTLVIFAVRTRRVPFWRSRPSLPLLLSVLGVVAVGAVLPATPFARDLGFQQLPGGFFAVLVVFVVVYLTLIDAAKSWFFARESRRIPTMARPTGHDRRVHRRAARFSLGHPSGEPRDQTPGTSSGAALPPRSGRSGSRTAAPV